MRASFELITYYLARRLLGLVARVIDRMPSQRPQDAQDGPSTPETTTDTPDTILSRHRAGTETP